jgi:hypothetical protein
MRRLHVPALLGLSALALPCSTAFAQRAARPAVQDETTFQLERELKITITLPELSNAQCSATSTTKYEQRNTIARVNGTLAVSDCTVASGAFTVAVRTRDEDGAEKPLEFSETWQRSDDQEVPFTADYPIGENMELVSVRLRGLTCTCADSTNDNGDPAATPEPPQEPTDAVP